MVILHADCDAFYASVEQLYRPELRGKPMAVGGDPEQRHGIILAKSYQAKRYGIKVGEALWQAKMKCKDLVIVTPNYHLYQRVSKMIRDIYLQYTEKVEAFGLDENWLDITGSINLLGSPYKIAKEIQQRVWKEIGITVSIGVSFNKIFAKLGSDYKKPHGLTVITKDNFKEKVWPLPVSDLLMVGRATNAKLNQRFIRTIGELANVSLDNLRRWFGKYGDMLHIFANGLDQTPVAEFDALQTIKSIGNSQTTPRDLNNEDDVKIMIYVLAESVARRMREQGFSGRLISVQIRNNQLSSIIRQHKIPRFTNITEEIAKEAMRIFKANYIWNNPIRSIGISVSDFEHDNVVSQADLFTNEQKRQELERLDTEIDKLKNRFGFNSVQRAVMLTDTELSLINPYNDNVIHPVSYLK